MTFFDKRCSHANKFVCIKCLSLISQKPVLCHTLNSRDTQPSSGSLPILCASFQPTGLTTAFPLAWWDWYHQLFISPTPGLPWWDNEFNQGQELATSGSFYIHKWSNDILHSGFPQGDQIGAELHLPLGLETCHHCPSFCQRSDFCIIQTVMWTVSPSCWGCLRIEQWNHWFIWKIPQEIGYTAHWWLQAGRGWVTPILPNSSPLDLY